MPARRRCFLRAFSETDCAGRLQRAHLVKQQTLKRETKGWRNDPRWWVWACVRHHWQLDKSRTLRIPRHRLPPDLEEVAREHGLLWALDREYGCLS